LRNEFVPKLRAPGFRQSPQADERNLSLAEINRIYQNEGIEFEASWFPVFYLLSKNESLSIKELSEQTGVSHPAASQLITNLKNK
jgi:phage-related holin